MSVLMDLREMSVLMDLREIWNNLDWDDFQDYITITKILLKQKKTPKDPPECEIE